MLISLRVGMMKPFPGQKWLCASCHIATPDCVSLLQAVCLLGVTRKLGDWPRDYSKLTRRSEFPAFSRMYWALTGIQNTRRSMQMLCERRACLNEGLPTRRKPNSISIEDDALSNLNKPPGRHVPGQPELIGNRCPNFARSRPLCPC